MMPMPFVSDGGGDGGVRKVEKLYLINSFLRFEEVCERKREGERGGNPKL